MQGSLGEKIGEGVSSDVHAWAPGQVVKLFKAGTPRRVSWYEARITRAVFAAGVPAPEKFGEITLDGRHGIVLGRLEGPPLLQHYRSGAVTFEQAGVILADLAMSVHRTPPPPEVITLREYAEHSLRNHPGRLPDHLGTGLLALIERLRPGDGLCHVDIHPGNVIMSAERPKLIDWITTVRAPAAFNLARIHVGLSEIAPTIVDNPERPRAVNTAAQSEYAGLAGMSSAELKAAIEPYLPIARAVVVLWDMPDLREPLRAKMENLPMPGAIATGTPTVDLTKTGDSLFTNAFVDNVLGTQDGFIRETALLYANGRDVKDPFLSPIYGDVLGFPPTILTSGTRDLYLSNTVRMHHKLRSAGVEAVLQLWEGQSHAQYLFDIGAWNCSVCIRVIRWDTGIRRSVDTWQQSQRSRRSGLPCASR